MALDVRYRPELGPELLDELRDRLVGVASHTAGRGEIPEGAIDWWVRQAAAVADEVLPSVVAILEDPMRRRVEKAQT